MDTNSVVRNVNDTSERNIMSSSDNNFSFIDFMNNKLNSKLLHVLSTVGDGDYFIHAINIHLLHVRHNVVNTASFRNEVIDGWEIIWK